MNLSPRPWKIAHSRDVMDNYRRYIEDAKDRRVAAMYHKDFCDYSTCMPDAEHIIKCVNEHDALVERNEYLEIKLEWLESMESHKSLAASAEKAEAEVDRLKAENQEIKMLLSRTYSETSCIDLEVEKILLR